MNENKLIEVIQEYRRDKYRQFKALEEKGWNEKSMKEFQAQWDDLLAACFNLEMHLEDITF